MAPKTAAEKDTRVAIPLAEFFKHVKVNGIDGTVFVHGAPYLTIVRAALNAKVQPLSNKSH
jgi:hypothetical protein